MRTKKPRTSACDGHIVAHVMGHMQWCPIISQCAEGNTYKGTQKDSLVPERAKREKCKDKRGRKVVMYANEEALRGLSFLYPLGEQKNEFTHTMRKSINLVHFDCYHDTIQAICILEIEIDTATSLFGIRGSYFVNLLIGMPAKNPVFHICAIRDKNT